MTTIAHSRGEISHIIHTPDTSIFIIHEVNDGPLTSAFNPSPWSVYHMARQSLSARPAFLLSAAPAFPPAERLRIPAFCCSAAQNTGLPSCRAAQNTGLLLQRSLQKTRVFCCRAAQRTGPPFCRADSRSVVQWQCDRRTGPGGCLPVRHLSGQPGQAGGQTRVASRRTGLRWRRCWRTTGWCPEDRSAVGW